jgi:hypothetical protein
MGYFGFMLRQAFQKNPHILRVCSGYFEKLSLLKPKYLIFRTGSPAQHFSASPAPSTPRHRGRSFFCTLIAVFGRISAPRGKNK